MRIAPTQLVEFPLPIAHAMSQSAWNFTVDDTSPMFVYQPYGDGNLTGGWATWYSGSGFNTAGGEASVGDSYHLTGFDGASIAFRFYGSAIYVYGTSNSTFDVTLDNTVTNGTASDGLLYSNTALPFGDHNVTITAHPSDGQLLMLDRAVVTAGPTPVQSLEFYNTNSSIKYSGGWSIATDPRNQIPSTANPGPYHKTTTLGDTASLQFTGGSAVAVYGAINWGNWIYGVGVDNSMTQLNGSTWWLVPNALLFFQAGLDPNTSHTISITNTATGNMPLYLNSVIVYGQSPSANGPSTHNPPGNSPSVGGIPVSGISE
ncbi:hypothetical protein BOTBODRAFT_470255 [Botryobasidium botryosum FD-172 SS1]|uniref:Uncharacterized protein n=1 Tax=Botryobasidium botryosum (strain FD-172 SS1) TaxID=930990 RepID=A0A067M8I3_BOTB1|nr:hypothetical protein BOTBODRAFT_470255 [Botryobasidium botryosum FD-172 SS1]